MKDHLKYSIISSIDLRGLSQSMKHFPAGIEHCDLYAFLQSDINSFMGEVDALNAVQYMNRFFDNDKKIEAAAQMVHDCVQPKKICALTSFIPEISSENEERRKEAQQAIRYLILFAKWLNRSFGHQIQTIELVGGTRLRIQNDIFRENEDAHVQVMSSDECIQRLCESLEALVPDLATSQPRVNLALELEPGPLHVISNFGVLLRLLEYLDANHKALSPYVGLNLDIPHWALLSKIHFEKVLREQKVFNRIIHAHISDHTKGHFCDNQLNLLNPASSFIPWINLLRLRYQKNRDLDMKYSGFISIEMEACKSGNMVDNSSRNLHSMLTDILLHNNLEALNDFYFSTP